MRRRIERIAQPAAHLIARDDSGQDLASRGADHLADRERGRHHRRARMQRGIGMGVVEIERMAERAVEQRRHCRRPGSGIAEHGGVALAVERKRLQHLEQGRRGFRIAPGADRAAEKVERQRLGARAHLRRDIFEFQVGDIGGERCGFIGHCVSLLLPRRVGGLNPSFKPSRDDRQQLCAMPFPSIDDVASTSGLRPMIALPKRLFGWPKLRAAQLALAVRVTVSAVVAFSLATALHLLLPLWAVLTSLIVTQMSVGRSLKVSRDYMFGTIGGAIYGGAIATLIPYSGEVELLGLLVLAVAPLALTAAFNPS